MYSFNPFVSSVDDGIVQVRIADNMMDEKDWGIDELVIKDGEVISQRHLTKGLYTMPDMVGWTVEELIQWTHYDSTGKPVENYHEIKITVLK